MDGRGKTERTWTATMLVALAGVLCLIVAGVIALSSDGPQTATAGPTAPLPTPPVDAESVGPVSEPPALANLVTRDLGSGGEADPLPRPIRENPQARHVQVSPDGSKLAFDDGSATYVADIDGSHVRKIDEGFPGVVTPAWSPDGRMLAVVGPGGTVALLDVRTGRRTVLLHHPGNIWFPNFSPDGGTLLFTTVGDRGLELWTAPVSGGRSTFLLSGAFGAYSPDGRHIAFRRTDYDGLDVTEMTWNGVFLADADGRHARRLGRDIDAMSQVDPLRLWPRWSPDGTRIAFEPRYGFGVRVVDVATGVVRRVDPGFDPVWLDDHTLIVERD